jgi:uncharacterized membrane protein
MTNMDNYEFIVAAYDGKDSAKEALKALNKEKKAGNLKYKDAVAAHKKENGKVKLYQAKENKGIIGGGAVGLLVGAVFSAGMLPAALLGMVIGGQAMKGLDNKDLKKVAEELGQDESALFMLVSEADWDAMETAMPEPKAILHREVVSFEVVTAIADLSEEDGVSEAMSADVETEEVE